MSLTSSGGAGFSVPSLRRRDQPDLEVHTRRVLIEEFTEQVMEQLLECGVLNHGVHA